MEKTHAVSKPGCKKSVAYHPKSGLKWMQSTKPLCQQQISDAMMKQEVAARFDMRKLGENERVESFDCGDADLNDFILNDALPYRKEKLAITYAYVDRHDNSKVVAFFCLSNDRISLTDFDDKSRYNRFSMRFVNKKRLKSYPAVKIGRLAVSESMKGMSIRSILLTFIKRYFSTDNKTGCRFITVDAYAAAVPFYLRNGFVPLNEEDANEPTRLLYFDLKDLDEE